MLSAFAGGMGGGDWSAPHSRAVRLMAAMDYMDYMDKMDLLVPPDTARIVQEQVAQPPRQPALTLFFAAASAGGTHSNPYNPYSPYRPYSPYAAIYSTARECGIPTKKHRLRNSSQPAFDFSVKTAYFSSAAFSFLSASTASRAALSASDMLPSTRPSSSSLMVRFSRSINI